MPRLEETVRTIEQRGLRRSPSAVVARLLELCGHSESIDELHGCIESDPGVAARVLKFAASGRVRLPEPPGDLLSAIEGIGARGTKIAGVAGLEVEEDSRDPIVAARRALQRRAMIRTVVTRALAHAVDYGRAEMAATAALLFEVGRLGALDAESPGSETLARAFERGEGASRLRVIEAAELGAGGAELTAAVLRSWGVARDLTVAIEVAGDLENDPPGGEAWLLPRALRVGELAAWTLGDGVPSEAALDALQPAAERLLGLSPERWLGCRAEMLVRFERATAMHRGMVPPVGELRASITAALAELSLASEAENREMHHRQSDLLRRVTTDPLTGVKNRAAFDERLEEEIERASRTGEAVLLMLCDLDDFKQINDQLGHLAGDLVLRGVAEAIDRSARKFDFVARYGGEEFAIIAPQCRIHAADSLAERVRQAVENARIMHDGKRVPVTVSIGAAAAEVPGQSRTPAALIAAADARLYEAKRAGKNCWRLDLPGTTWAAAS